MGYSREQMRRAMALYAVTDRAWLKPGESLAAVAARQGMMPEVLADGINEKAVDTVGDSLLDGALALYEDYLEPVKGMLEGMVKE